MFLPSEDEYDKTKTKKWKSVFWAKSQCVEGAIVPFEAMTKGEKGEPSFQRA